MRNKFISSVRNYMDRNGITIVEFAHEAGYNHQYVCRVFRGHVPLTPEFKNVCIETVHRFRENRTKLVERV